VYMAKADKQVIINFIIGCLRKGESRAAILGKVGKKWETSRTTFDRLLKTAKEEQNQTQQVIKKAKAALDIEIELQSHAELIADVHERKQTLTKIMRGQIQLTKPMVVNGILELVPVVPDWGERRSAISELNRKYFINRPGHSCKQIPVTFCIFFPQTFQLIAFMPWDI